MNLAAKCLRAPERSNVSKQPSRVSIIRGYHKALEQEAQEFINEHMAIVEDRYTHGLIKEEHASG